MIEKIVVVTTKNKCPNCNEQYILTFAGWRCPKCLKGVDYYE